MMTRLHGRNLRFVVLIYVGSALIQKDERKHWQNNAGQKKFEEADYRQDKVFGLLKGLDARYLILER